jgi:hypothetical protein
MADRKATRRPAIRNRDKIAVWAAAAGRCTFCNCLVLENEVLGSAVPIGELAHNVGWDEISPRGDSDLSMEERRSAMNLVLSCGNCHKPIDSDGINGLYSVEKIEKLKREHETRIRFVTGIGADRAAYVVRLVANVRGVPPQLDRNTVLAATISSGLLPKNLPNTHWEDVELDLRNHEELNSAEDFENCMPLIKGLADRLHSGVQRNDVKRVAFFGFAPVPLLIAFGATLDDKLETHIFQRHRVNSGNPWLWPEEQSPVVRFERDVSVGDDASDVALIINLSGTIRVDELPEAVRKTHTVYSISPSAPERPGPSLIRSLDSLHVFELTMREFLAHVELSHGKIRDIKLFPALPLSAATIVGRVLMPDVSPSWIVFDRDQNGKFVEALKVGS